jgi:hypothetical protein
MPARECQWLVRCAGLLVPGAARASWLRRRDSDLWFRELEARRAGKSDARIRAALIARAGASFGDALWQRVDREFVARSVRTPQFCLLALLLLLISITVASDGLARTRRIVRGAAFGNGERVVSMCIQEVFMGRRLGVTPAAVRKWYGESRTLEKLGAYVFTQPWYANGFLLHRGPAPARLAHAQVTPEFFNILGVKPARGKFFDESECADCLVITQRLKRQLLHTSDSVVGRTIDYDGARWRVIGELPDDFWFMTQKLGGVSLIDTAAARGRVVGLGLLRAGLSVEAAESELRRIVRLPTLEVAALSVRLQEPLRTFVGGSLVLVAIVALVSAAAVIRRRSEWRFWAFFFAKTALATTAVLLVAIDYGGAGQLSITGGNQPGEPVAFWMWIVGTVLCLWWSITDQKMRCRTCQSRFVMPVRIGSPDRVLFEHEATEMVCPKGHGTLFVDGMTETFRQEGRWTKLDESWKDFFVEK